MVDLSWKEIFIEGLKYGPSGLIAIALVWHNIKTITKMKDTLDTIKDRLEKPSAYENKLTETLEVISRTMKEITEALMKVRSTNSLEHKEIEGRLDVTNEKIEGLKQR